MALQVCFPQGLFMMFCLPSHCLQHMFLHLHNRQDCSELFLTQPGGPEWEILKAAVSKELCILLIRFVD